MKTIVLLIVVLKAAKLPNNNEKECNFPLGMEDGRIKDDQITATAHHVDSSAAHFSRLNGVNGAGAWCHSSIDKDERDQYLQIELTGLALVNLIAIQGRHNGQESVQQIQVNSSLDGQEWHKVALIDGLNDEQIGHRPIPPTNARLVRLIPLTDRKMPVCIRTEIFGCYRDDQLHHYKLSKPAIVSDDNLNSDLSGVGQLTNGDTEDWMTFPDGHFTVDFAWDSPKNISNVGITVQSEQCLKEVNIHLPNGLVMSHELYCKVGVQFLSFSIDRVTANISISFEYEGRLSVSEIEWQDSDELNDGTTLTPVKSINLNMSSADLNYLAICLAAAGVLLVTSISVSCCICLRKRFQKSAKNDYASTPTMSDGTWFNLVPSQADSYNRRSECVYLKQTKSSQSGSSIVNSVHYGQPTVTSSYATGKQFHEYSEIGSIMADSGRGESLTEEKHYAQIRY